MLLLTACSPATATPTVTVEVPPSATATEILPTATETIVPTATATPKPQISVDQMNAIVSSTEKNLASGFHLTENPDGSHSITGADGKVVNNIVLKGDGNFHVTEPDGTDLAISPLTVFMPDDNTIYAELNKIDIPTGTVSEIPIDLTMWNAGDNDPIITDGSLPRYENWIYNQLVKTGKLDQLFAGADPNMKWAIIQNTFFSKTATVDALLPAGTKTEPKPVDIPAQPPLDNIPTRSVESFVRNASHPGTSVTPVFIENANPSADVPKYALFPGVVATSAINAPQTDPTSMSYILKPDAFGNQNHRYLVVVSKIESQSTTDGLSERGESLSMFSGSADTHASDRDAILQSGVSTGNFPNPERYLWPLSNWYGSTK